MKRILTIWAILGAAYVALETVFRGYSHPSMLIVGGLCGVLVGTINQRPGFFRAPVIMQAVIGALCVKNNPYDEFFMAGYYLDNRG